MNGHDALAERLPSLPAMTPSAVASIRALERVVLDAPQLPLVMYHLLHAGLYARTVTIPKGAVITGALIKRATVLIVAGDVSVAIGEDCIRLVGYQVVPAAAGRKQAFYAHADTTMTMLFPTSSRDIAAVEAEFTDETDMLGSRMGENVVRITEET